MFESDEEKILERVYNPDEDDYIIKTRDKTKKKKLNQKLKLKTKSILKLGLYVKNVMKNLEVK